MSNNHNNNTQSSFLDIYNTLLHNTLINYNQTIDTIRQIESGIREVLRHDNNNNYSNNHNNNYNNNIHHSAIPYFHTNRGLPHTINTVGSNNTIRQPRLGQQNPRPSSNTNFDRLYSPINAGQPTIDPRLIRRPINNLPIRTNRTDRTDRTNRTDRTDRTTTEERLPSLLSNILLYSFNPSGLDNLTPVIVRPTSAEISNATELIRWDVDIGHDMCSITQELFTVNDMITRLHHCGHCFKTEAINTWFNASVFCPVCRYDIRQYNNNPNIPINSIGNDDNEDHVDNSDSDVDDQEEYDIADSTRANATASSNATISSNATSRVTSSGVTNMENSSEQNDLNSIAVDFITSFTSQLATLHPTLNNHIQSLGNVDNSNNLFNTSDIFLEYIIQTPSSTSSTNTTSTNQSDILYNALNALSRRR